MAARNGRLAVDRLQRDLGGGLDALGRQPGFAELGGERHRETTGVRRGDQLLGIRPRLVLEAGDEAVGRVLERAALRAHRSRAGLEIALPHCARVALHRSTSGLVVVLSQTQAWYPRSRAIRLRPERR